MFLINVLRLLKSYIYAAVDILSPSDKSDQKILTGTPYGHRCDPPRGTPCDRRLQPGTPEMLCARRAAFAGSRSATSLGSAVLLPFGSAWRVLRGSRGRSADGNAGVSCRNGKCAAPLDGIIGVLMAGSGGQSGAGSAPRNIDQHRLAGFPKGGKV